VELKEVLAKIIAIIAEVKEAGLDTIKREMKLDELGIDMLDGAEIALMLEDEFQLSIPVDDAEEWKTVMDMVNYIQARQNKESPHN